MPNRPGDGGLGPNRPETRPGSDGWSQLRPGDNRPTRPTRPDWNGGNHNTIIGGGGNTINIGGGNNVIGNGNINNRPWVGDHMNHWNNNWNNHWDHCRHNHGWYHGCWNGNWNNPWAVAGIAWGLNMWAFNSMAYDSGYYSYSNPYYEPAAVVEQVPVLDYSQPVAMNYEDAPPEGTAEPPPTPAEQQAAQTFDAARAAFKSGDYRKAGTLTEQAMKALPKDPVLHEFRALCLFALGEYKPAAAALNALLAVSPGWDWTTMASLYDSTATYEAQLRKLEEAAKADAKRPELQFLLGYHYLITGNTDAAKIVLTNAVRLAPGDTVAAQLLKAIGGEAPATAPMPMPTPPQPMTAADLQLDIRGDWKAARPGQPTIGLTLAEDGKFTWKVTQASGKSDSFGGTFTVDGDMLMLERSAGGALMGKVKPLSDKSFNFSMVGAPASDPGLTFAR